jgi:hypothetical protein
MMICGMEIREEDLKEVKDEEKRRNEFVGGMHFLQQILGSCFVE